MRKLLQADFARIRRQKAFWAELILIAVYSVWVVISTYRNTLEYNQPMDTAFAEVLFAPITLGSIFLAVFCSLFVGTEYSDGTIRNKLIVGHARTGIYLANFTSCTVTALLQSAIALAIIWAAGLPLLGLPQITPAAYIQTCGSLFCLCMAYAALYNLTAMLSSSKTHTAVINILASFILLFTAVYFYQALSEPEMINQMIMADSGNALETVPNPRFLTGTKRMIYQFLFDFIPSGQTFQIANFAHGSILLCIYSLIITVLSNVFGIIIFHKKDIK